MISEPCNRIHQESEFHVNNMIEVLRYFEGLIVMASHAGLKLWSFVISSHCFFLSLSQLHLFCDSGLSMEHKPVEAAVIISSCLRTKVKLTGLAIKDRNRYSDGFHEAREFVLQNVSRRVSKWIVTREQEKLSVLFCERKD